MPGAVIAGVLQLLLQQTQSSKTASDFGELRRRLDNIEATLRNAARDPRACWIEGDALRLLAALAERELGELWAVLEAKEARSMLGLSPDTYAEAVSELEHLGLVRIDGNANARHGIGRTRLRPAEFLPVAPALLDEVRVPEEIVLILQTLEANETPGRYFTTAQLLALLPIPRPRADMWLQALVELELLEGRLPAHPDYGSYWAVTLTIAGRRVLRGRDPLPR